MKPLRIFIFVFLLTLPWACQEIEEPLSEEALLAHISQIKTQIDSLIGLSTGLSSGDCRTYYIPGGNGCGPIYTYGVQRIDTTQLENLFLELASKQNILYSRYPGPVCDLSFPVKDSLIDGTCQACYVTDSLNNLSCF
ncbi:MAG: hypothetical protein AAFU64_16105 [Bacteroidota bacterium]